MSQNTQMIMNRLEHLELNATIQGGGRGRRQQLNGGGGVTGQNVSVDEKKVDWAIADDVANVSAYEGHRRDSRSAPGRASLSAETIDALLKDLTSSQNELADAVKSTQMASQL